MATCEHGYELIGNTHRTPFGIDRCKYEPLDKKSQALLDRLDGSGF